MLPFAAPCSSYPPLAPTAIKTSTKVQQVYSISYAQRIKMSLSQGPMPPEAYNMAIDFRNGFFHAMLSYRVSTDQDFVSKLHDKVHLLAPAGETNDVRMLDLSPYPSGFRRDESVMNSSMRVFQDAYCLRDGMGWEGDGGIKNGGFIGALRLSLVFVPVFSVKVDGSGHIVSPGEGSIGGLIELGNQDKQDNVLLELIIARELHVLTKKSGRKALLPCSYILPLFRNKEVWEAAKHLPNKPSAITNAKALLVMEQLGVPSSSVSNELSTGTLTVKAVWDFFAQFQGNMLFDCGKEAFQIVAAAKAIVGVVRESMSEFNFQDQDMNFAQIYELSGFMSQLNMANYTSVLAAHHITNVAQLAHLDHHGADAVMRSIAEQCARASDRSTVPNEIVRLRSAVAAALTSPLGRPLNERLQNFIDNEASFVTMLSSSSFCDILASKWQSWMCIVPAMLYSIGSSIYSNVIRAMTHDATATGLPFPQNDSLALYLLTLPGYVCYFIVILACPMSLLKSPRHGRYMVASALFVWATVYTLVFSISVDSAIHSNCINCMTYTGDLNKGSVLQKILAQPLNFIVFWVALFCVLFRQQYTVPTVFSLLILLSIPNGVFFVQGLVSFRTIASNVVFLGAYVVLKTLQFIGNRRARSIFDLNQATTGTVYNELCQSFEIFGSLTSRTHKSPTRCCLVVKRRRITNVAPLLTMTPRDATSTTLTRSEMIFDIDSFFQMENIGQQLLLQPHYSFESLIRDAEFINFAFQEWASSWLSNGPDSDKIQRFLYHSADSIDSPLSNLSSKAAESPINGAHIRGPVKHVDRSIEKVHRSYCGNFKKLCDVVRCCLVLDTPDDMINLIKKIFFHAKVAEVSANPLQDRIASLWNTLLVRGLGLIPIRDTTHADHQHISYAFEILRVRNRFACANSVGGYRDINFKIRVGFRSDPKTGGPLFCPVNYWHESDVKTMIVEIQLQLKDLHECTMNKEYHRNYIRARNLMSQ